MGKASAPCHRVDLDGPPTVCELIADRGSQFLELCDRLAILFGSIDRATCPPRSHEHRPQGIIVLLRDRLELMIVTPRASDRRGKKSFREGIDLVVDHLLMHAVEIAAAAVTMLTHMIKHRSDQALDDSDLIVDSRIAQQIPGDLFDEQRIEPDVLVERSDQVIPVLMRSFGWIIPFVPIGIRVAHHIHPAPSHGLSEMR